MFPGPRKPGAALWNMHDLGASPTPDLRAGNLQPACHCTKQTPLPVRNLSDVRLRFFMPRRELFAHSFSHTFVRHAASRWDWRHLRPEGAQRTAGTVLNATTVSRGGRWDPPPSPCTGTLCCAASLPPSLHAPRLLSAELRVQGGQCLPDASTAHRRRCRQPGRARPQL